jgi:hypothetical protein
LNFPLEEMEMRAQPTADSVHLVPEVIDLPAGDDRVSSELELTVEEASRLAVTAVTSDLEYWACSASVDGRVGLNDLVRVLDVIRRSSVVS